MFIFNSSRQEKGLCAMVALRPFLQSAATIGCTAGIALADGMTPKNLLLLENGTKSTAVSGFFHCNVGIKSVTLGEKTFELKDADMHAPIAVKLFAQSNDDAQKFDAVTDADIGTKNGAFQFALSHDINQVPGMTALDVSQSSDFGRMIAPTGMRATRTQMFMSLPERDNNDSTHDKTPELILMGAIPNGTIKITPILAGNSDILESLVFGPTLELNPSDLAAGITGISIMPQGMSNPLKMCVVGLDLSGDLKVEKGHTVVGYQLESPAGSNTGIKLVSVGTQESNVYASDASLIELGSIESVESPSIVVYAQANSPSVANLGSAVAGVFGEEPNFIGNTELILTSRIGPLFKIEQNGGENLLSVNDVREVSIGATEAYDDGGGGAPNTPFGPPVPPVPGPSTLLVLAAGFAARRRNTHTRGEHAK